MSSGTKETRRTPPAIQRTWVTVKRYPRLQSIQTLNLPSRALDEHWPVTNKGYFVVDQFRIVALDWGTIGARLICMCFKITPSLREHFNYRGISAELEQRGYGSSRPQLAWAIRQKQHEAEEPADEQNKGVNSSLPNAPDSN